MLGTVLEGVRRTQEHDSVLCSTSEPSKLSLQQITARRRIVHILIAIVAIGLIVAFGYSAEVLSPTLSDRRQILTAIATMSATLLGLLLAAATFVFRIHIETLQTQLGAAAGITKGMRSFWKTAVRVVTGLVVSVMASLFGLLAIPSAYSLDLIVLAGGALIYAVLFVWLVVNDLWGSLRAGQA